VAESVIRLSVINDASSKLRAVDRDAKKLGRTVKNSNGVLNNQSKSLKAAALGWVGVGTSAKAAQPAIVGAGAALATALAPIAALTSGIAVLTGAMTIFAKQDAATAALKTLKVNTDKLVPSLLQVSKELNHQFNQTELTIAAYDVASAGFTDAADAAMVLKASALAARAGMADLATTGDAVTTVLNAWKMSASEAEMVADKMQQTVADGKIKISEYAQNIGKVASVAAMVNVPLEEVNAAIALTTASGVKAEVAFTGMKTALLRLTGEAGGKKLKALGIDISAATLKAEGLAANLEKLADLDIKALEQIFGQEAIQTIAPIIASLEKYNELLEKQANSANVARDAANDQATTIAGAWKELTTVVSNLFSKETELQKTTAHLIRLTTAGIKLIAWLLEPVVDTINLCAAAVNEVAKAFPKVISQVKLFGTNFGIALENVVIGIKHIWDNFDKLLKKALAQIKLFAENFVIAIKNVWIDIINNMPDPIKWLFGIDKNVITPKIEYKVLNEDQFDIENPAFKEFKKGDISTSVKGKTPEKTNKAKKDEKETTDAMKRWLELSKKLDEQFKKVGETITESLADGIKGLIKGTQTLGEMLGNIANKVADMLLDIGIRAGLSAMGLPVAGFAAGGRPPVGKPSIVGEKGPELFVPRQAGTIIPNNQLGGGGSTSVVVNVDASGSSVEGDAGQAEQLGSMLAAAVQAEIARQQRPGGLLAAR
jgi:TP901 family phage tail tape measure protein